MPRACLSWLGSGLLGASPHSLATPPLTPWIINCHLSHLSTYIWGQSSIVNSVCQGRLNETTFIGRIFVHFTILVLRSRFLLWSLSVLGHHIVIYYYCSTTIVIFNVITIVICSTYRRWIIIRWEGVLGCWEGMGSSASRCISWWLWWWWW